MITVSLGSADPQIGTGGNLTATNSPAHCHSVANGGGPGGTPVQISSALLTGFTTSSTAASIYIQINESGSWQLFGGALPISSSLFALQSESLGGGGNLFYVNNTGQLTSNGTPLIDTSGNWIGGAGTIPGSAITGAFPGTVNGANITGLTASQLTPGGTFPAENGSNITNINVANFTVGGTFPAENASNLTNLNGAAVTAGSLPASALAPGGTFPAENGSGITNLTAANVTGSLASATIPWANVSGHPTDLASFTNSPGYVTAGGSVNYATTAGSANSVAWANVTGHPTDLASFTNSPGYVTAGGSVNYATSANYANTAGSANSVAWGNVSGAPGDLASFTNSPGYTTQGWVQSQGYATNHFFGGCQVYTVGNPITVNISPYTIQSASATTTTPPTTGMRVPYIDATASNFGAGVVVFRGMQPSGSGGGGLEAQVNFCYTIVSN